MPPLHDAASWGTTPAPWCRVLHAALYLGLGFGLGAAYMWLSYRRG